MPVLQSQYQRLLHLYPPGLWAEQALCEIGELQTNTKLDWSFINAWIQFSNFQLSIQNNSSIIYNLDMGLCSLLYYVCDYSEAKLYGKWNSLQNNADFYIKKHDEEIYYFYIDALTFINSM